MKNEKDLLIVYNIFGAHINESFQTECYIHSCGFFLPNYPELTNKEIDFISSVVVGK